MHPENLWQTQNQSNIWMTLLTSVFNHKKVETLEIQSSIFKFQLLKNWKKKWNDDSD
jgi:hypothetical protein